MVVEEKIGVVVAALVGGMLEVGAVIRAEGGVTMMPAYNKH